MKFAIEFGIWFALTSPIRIANNDIKKCMLESKLEVVV